MISTFLDASYNINTNSTKTGLRELLKEKTGKDYQLKEQTFKISFGDLADYIDKNVIQNSKKNIIEFFEKVDFRKLINEETDIETEWEAEKLNILLCLLQDKKRLKKFLSDVQNVDDYDKILKSYMEWTNDYYSEHRIIG